MCIYGETNCGNGHQKKNKPRDWKHFLSKMKYLKQPNKHEESVSQILFFEIIVSSYIAVFRGQSQMTIISTTVRKNPLEEME